MSYYLGVDLAQRNDYTAVAVVRAAGEWRDWHLGVPDSRIGDVVPPDFSTARRGAALYGTSSVAVPVYEVAALDRIRGKPYDEIITQLSAFAGLPQVRPHGCELIVDETGVGVAVVDMMTARGLDPVRVTITGGDEASQVGARAWRTPKRDLVVGLQVLLDDRRLRVAQGLEHWPTLRHELSTFEYRIAPRTGHDQYGVWREGEHDDLVLALALAVWFPERALPRSGGFAVGNVFDAPDPYDELDAYHAPDDYEWWDRRYPELMDGQ